MHLYMGGEISANLSGSDVVFNIDTNYPWDENIRVTLELKEETHFKFGLRIPEWCRNYTIKINDEKVKYEIINGYAYIDRVWQNANEINVLFNMPIEIMSANINVRENIGKVAIMRGPIVYCLEEDNGSNLHRVYLSNNPELTHKYEKDLLGGIVTIEGNGKMIQKENWDDDKLYKSNTQIKFEDKKLKWIPYYSWANRTPGEMIVWVRNQF